MNKDEQDIIDGTKEFAKAHNIHYDQMTENMILNALREQLTIDSVSVSFFDKLFKPHLMWDWYDFGIVLKISKQNNIGNYHFAIDIQIAWLNLWVQCWKKQK